MKAFQIPEQYRSPLIGAIKQERKVADRMKKDFSPTVLQYGNLEIILARHFGFCYGVENAMEIAFRAIEENAGKRIFLISEMIHNAGVNNDLQNLGVRFIMDTKGKMIVPWDEITSDDIVIVPAFGTTVETEKILTDKNIDVRQYETTCPFVVKVWNKAAKIGEDGYTVVIHGKPGHEETRATFSHSATYPTVVIKDLKQAELLAAYITGNLPEEQFYTDFQGQYSAGFNPLKDLQRIGVVNQTTMLATDTQAIADYLKQTITQHYNLAPEEYADRFADTRDTLCYATNDNQSAVIAMLQERADFALVIGGYNSSNTAHLVELCEEKLPTYLIKNQDCLLPNNSVSHFDLHLQEERWSILPQAAAVPIRIMITSGASCPDALVEQVIIRLQHLFV
jgi:4-hydroxy-3-methylbut-2-en-1-yl diphosphate reductase